MVDGCDVTFGEIDYVDKIAHTGAIRSIVVVAVDLELGDFAGGDFHDDWHEVVRDIVGIFADKSGRVCADWIKISKHGYSKIRIGYYKITEDLFDHVFGLAIRIGDAKASLIVFGKFNAVLVPVNGG